MKIAASILGFILLISCSKQVNKRNRAFLDLSIEGSAKIFVWEEIESNWNYNTGDANIHAISDERHQFVIRLKGITDTGKIALVTIDEINYHDDHSFVGERITDGSIRVTDASDRLIKGEFYVTLFSSYLLSEAKTLKGSFGITR